MSWSIQYSKSINFPNGINIRGIRTSINNDSNITPQLLTITIYDDVITFTFDSEVIGGELTYLNNFIVNYIDDVIVINDIIHIPVNRNAIGQTIYTRVAWLSNFATIYDEKLNINFIVDVDSNITQFSIRVVNISNGDIYAEQTYVDMSKSMYKLDNIINLGLDESIIEIQCKKTGGNQNDYVNFITIYILL